MDPLLYSVADTAELLGLGPTKVYALIKSGAIVAVRSGGQLRITKQAIDDYIASLPRAGEPADAPILTGHDA